MKVGGLEHQISSQQMLPRRFNQEKNWKTLAISKELLPNHCCCTPATLRKTADVRLLRFLIDEMFSQQKNSIAYR
jgi:hypothetical protein